MMPQTRRPVLAVVVIVLVGAIAAVFYGRGFAPVHVPGPPPVLAKLKLAARPKAVPAVAFADAQDQLHRLAEFRGRYVLLNLWATWCAPCVKELPALAGLKRTIGNAKLAVIAVNVGRDNVANTAKFLKAHDAATLLVYRDVNTAFLHAFGAFGLPLTVLIGPDGREVARAIGAVQWDDKDSIAYFRSLTARKTS